MMTKEMILRKTTQMMTLNNLYGINKIMPCANLIINILQSETEMIPCILLIQKIKDTRLIVIAG